MTEQFTIELMLADKGGMLITDGGKGVYPSDRALANEIGWIVLEVHRQTCVDNSKITVIIETHETDNNTLRRDGR